jgi:predicted nucleic acid-binding protein
MIMVDTTPLVALCDPRDSQHQTARVQIGQLAPRELCTCEAVVMEACFHLPHQSQRRRLRAILDELGIASLPVTHDHDFWLEVLDWLLKYAEHEPDWADGCIAVLSGRDPRLKVWTYDREFRTTWRRPDGTAIPMAVRVK